MKQIVFIFFFFTSMIYTQDATYKLFVFEGSDWCVNCLKLEKGVLSDALFKQYLKEHHIALEKVDFPQKLKQAKNVQKQNKELAKKYNFEGIFPTLVLVKSSTQEFLKLEAKKTANLIEEINQKSKKL